LKWKLGLTAARLTLSLCGKDSAMNELGYRRTDENGLSFELLVDGEPLGDIVGAQDAAIPYWIIDDDLPYLPPHGAARHSEIRIVTVCSCGEYGCGHTECRVIRLTDSVVFRDFDMDCTPDGKTKQFTFTPENYDRVVGQIVNEAQKYKQQQTS
jgi:hypothetical protein